jgi:diaminopimelate decarboxylase/aspartate kinase
MTRYVHAALGDLEGVETPYPDSPWVVMKFGGSSVAAAENWQRIASFLRERLEEGVRPVVCHSALFGVSNALIALIETAISGAPTDELLHDIRARHDNLAKTLNVDSGLVDPQFAALEQLIVGVRLIGEATPRVHARILSVGELAATTLGAAFLNNENLPVTWMDASTLLETVHDPDQTERARFLSARCDYTADPELARRLSATSGIVLTQGFIARNGEGDVVLLGRGGSDTSAAYLAGKLEARRLEIWTDVPGFFSADPRAVPSARLIRSLQYREAQEISSAGGGVLHPRSISPVRHTGIPLFLKCTAHPEWEGTVVSDAPVDDTPQLKAISYRSGITLVSMDSMDMWHQVGFLATAFECFRRHGISVDLISTSESNVTVSIDETANVTDAESVETLAADLRRLCSVTVLKDCAAITLVGRRIRTILHELASVLEVFEEHRVHLVTQAANDLNLTFVVGSEHAYKLVQKIHGLLVSRFKGGVFGPTWDQLSAPGLPAVSVGEQPWWKRRQGELIEIGAAHGAAYVYDRASVVEAARALTSLSNVDRVLFAMKANSHREILKEVNAQGLDFECVSPGEIERVRETLPELAPDRILFTPNFAPRREYEWALQQGVWLTLDNLYPLREWREIFRGREIFVRIDTGQGRGHHEHVRTAGVHSKFGVPLFEVDELAELAEQAGASVVGLHAHTGSGVLQADTWGSTGQTLVGIAGRFPAVRYFNVGGGLGIPERPGQDALDLGHLDEILGDLKTAAHGAQIWLEPGRYIVAQAGVLLTQVTQTKGKGDLQYLGVTTGMNSLIRPALYGAYHEIVNLSRMQDMATELTTVVGPICETGDRLGSDRLMPQASEGDVVLIANTGAYGYVMSSHYNLRPPAAEIVI